MNDWDVYAQKLDANGNALWAPNGVVVSDAIEIQGHPKNIPDGQGGSIFVWQDKRSGFYDIYVHRIFYDGYNVGLKEESVINSFESYPNPFSDEINISVARKSSEDLKWALFNINGTRIMGIDVILTEDSDIQNFKLLTKDLTPGMYYLCVGNSIVSKTLKLIKN